jgi:hypothetical protein
MAGFKLTEEFTRYILLENAFFTLGFLKENDLNELNFI